MSDRYFMGYRIHYHTGFYLPNTVLFSKDGIKITVAMAKDALNYILSMIALKNPVIKKYKKAKVVFSGMKMILENNQPPQISKEDAKTAVDVLEEITNMTAQTDAEKEQNARCAFICKMMIDGFGGEIR